jgi:hypothetical protein
MSPTLRAGGTQTHRHRLLADIQPGDPVEHDLHRIPPFHSEGGHRLPAPVRRDLCQDTDPRLGRTAAPCQSCH